MWSIKGHHSILYPNADKHSNVNDKLNELDEKTENSINKSDQVVDAGSSWVETAVAMVLAIESGGEERTIDHVVEVFGVIPWLFWLLDMLDVELLGINGSVHFEGGISVHHDGQLTEVAEQRCEVQHVLLLGRLGLVGATSRCRTLKHRAMKHRALYRWGAIRTIVTRNFRAGERTTTSMLGRAQDAGSQCCSVGTQLCSSLGPACQQGAQRDNGNKGQASHKAKLGSLGVLSRSSITINRVISRISRMAITSVVQHLILHLNFKVNLLNLCTFVASVYKLSYILRTYFVQIRVCKRICYKQLKEILVLNLIC